ncbi:MAG: hypothetical protein LUD72_10410, partial [Bacteroidales bacterium]|nr:hypothetical protein [Bacteroidales bacterium]
TTKDSKGKPQPLEDICDTLAGRYPKDFKFVGWHPHCRCIATPILKTEEEMEADTERILNGEEPLSPETSRNYIGELPEKFTKWLDKNSERIENAKSLPYFLKDNEGLINGATAGTTINATPTAPATPTAVAGGTGNSGNNGNNSGRTPKTLQEQVDYICLNPTKGKPLTFDELQDEYFVEGPWNLSDKKLELCYKQGIAGKFDFAGVKEDITKLAKLYGIDITDCRIDIESSNRFNVVYSGKGFLLERSFYTDAKDDYKLKVTHKYLTLATEYQGKGISKGVIRSLYGRYVDMGVEEINVCANIDVGGYTWARYGFSASRTEIAELISSTNRLSDSARQNTLDFIKNYYDSHNLGNDDPFPMNKLVDYWGRDEAKRILAGTNWHGKIDLTDDEQRKIFEEYMGYKKKDK